MATEVIFTPDEMCWLESVAHNRNDPKEARGIPSKRISQGHTNYEIHLAGVMAEEAVARQLPGAQINAEPLLGGDGAITDIIFRGKRIQIKCVFNPNMPLYFRDRNGFKADMAVLCIKTGANTIKICGYIDQAMFLAEQQPYDWHEWGKCWGVPQSKLSPLTELLYLWPEPRQATV